MAGQFTGETLTLPLPRVDYADSDGAVRQRPPDFRYGMELKDIADIAAETEFKVFEMARSKGDRIRGICVPAAAESYSRKDLDGLTEYAKSFGASGLVWLKVEAAAFAGPTAKFFPAPAQAKLRERFGAQAGDLILIVADSQAVSSQSLSNLRIKLAADRKLYDPKSYHYSWVVRFPLLHWDAEEQRYAAEHHPFTMPLPEDLELLATDPAKVRAQAYDLVVNGEECGGGTIRCHDPKIQSRIFELLGLTPGASRGEVRLPPQRPQERRPAPRRDRPGRRPPGDALRRPDQHPRLHRLPQDRQGHRPHDRRPRDRRLQAAPRAARPDGGVSGRASKARPI